jgi:MFS transporter, DHA1 family, multidrug resistance protein
VAFAVLFLSFVDVFALLPTVAPYATTLGAGPAALGLVVGAYSAANLPANLLGGALVDRFGRRPVLLLGLLTAAVAVAEYSFAATPGQLVGIRLVHGAAGGLLVPAVFAVAGDHTATAGAGRTMGRAGALIGAAAVVAPASAGILRQVAGPEAVFLAVAALLVVGALLTAVGVRAGGPDGSDGSDGSFGRPDPRRPARLLQDPTVRRTLLAVVATTAAVGVLAGFLPGTVERRGGAAATGLLFTVYALVAAVIMLSPAAAAVDREGPRRSLTLGLGLLAGGLGLLAAAAPGGGLGWSVVGVGVFGAGYGLIFPAASGAVALASAPERRGWAFGWFNVAFSLGIAVGAPAVGAATGRFPGLDPFLLVAGACLVAAVATSLPLGPAGPRGADQDRTPDGPRPPRKRRR